MMKSINRRDFIDRGVKIVAGLSGLGFAGSSAKITIPDILSATIPLPIQVVIDDVGWWSGQDGSLYNEPFRTGILRNHVPSDYSAIVELGKALNIRPQAAMVMCEWDKFNILRELPSSTWMGKNWDNSKWVGPWMEEAAGIIRDNNKYFEITLHAVGHEHWAGTEFTRAEWADENGVMRSPDEVERHLDYFEKIMHQHRLGEFPVSFVPSAFKHGFGVTGNHNISMAEILIRRGINYINTPFSSMLNADDVPHEHFGFDNGVLTINRGRDVLGWKATGVPPARLLTGPTCGMHWANLIHPDPDRNMDIVGEWINFLSPYNDKEETMLAPDSGYFKSQLLYQACTKITRSGNMVVFDFSNLDDLPSSHTRKEFTLNITSRANVKFESNDLQVLSRSLKKVDGNNLFSLKLKRSVLSDRSFLEILPGS